MATECETDAAEIASLGDALIARIHSVYESKLAASNRGKAYAASREIGQAIMRVEEGVMWAMKALAMPTGSDH